MKKYTLVFMESFSRGSHFHNIVGIQRIATNDIRKVIETENLDVQYVFEGHSKIEGEEGNEKFLEVREYKY